MLPQTAAGRQQALIWSYDANISSVQQLENNVQLRRNSQPLDSLPGCHRFVTPHWLHAARIDVPLLS
jgi:hypothetical protein